MVTRSRQPRGATAALLPLAALLACSSGSLSEGENGDADTGSDGGGPACGTIVCPEGMECVDGRCVHHDPCADVACENPGEVCSGGVCVSGERDGDGDGYPARADCDDEDPTILPGSTRPCVNGCGEGLSTCGVDGTWSGCEFERDPCELPHAEAACVDGACALVACEGGYADCSGGDADGCETALGTDADCGGCGDRCTGMDHCIGGSCRCVPSCSGAACGDADGCGGRCDGSCPPNHTCEGGTCVCHPDCSGAACNADDGCGGLCTSGSCPPNEVCGSSGCYCPGPHYGYSGSSCVPSCGALLGDLGYFDNGTGCCSSPCAAGVRQAGGPGDTFDCSYCCEGTTSGSPCS